jgi:hypothetical protein
MNEIKLVIFGLIVLIIAAILILILDEPEILVDKEIEMVTALGVGLLILILDSKSQTGTGLGLFISKSIIEAHGSKIWAENNKDGTGATFGFALPIAKSHNDNLHTNDNQLL